MPVPLHTICKVPEELLSMIFVEWLENHIRNRWGYFSILEDFQVAFCLAAVSRKWRSVAIATPQLWCYVNVELKRVNLQTQEHWADYLQTCLLRSGAIPVELKVTGRLEVAWGQLEFWNSLRTCFAHARAIDLDLGIAEPPMPAPFLHCFAQDMPHLDYLRFSCDNNSLVDTPSNITFFTSAPRLWHLYYNVLGLNGLSWPADSIFPNVTSASMICDGLSTSALVELLQHLPNVQDLEVDTPFLSAADAPADLSALRRPTLRKLTLNTAGFDETIVRAMHFPNLHSAVLQLSRHRAISPAALAAFFGHTLRSVRQLAFLDGDYLGQGLFEGLRSMPWLSSLWLASRTPDAEILLEEMSRPDAAGEWPCKYLLHISLSSWDIDRWAARGLALHVAAARGPCAPPDHRPKRLLQVLRVTSSSVEPFAWRAHSNPSEEALQAAVDRLLSVDMDTESDAEG